MIIKTINKEKWRFRVLSSTLFIFFILHGNQAFAVGEKPGAEGISVLEILGYIGMIVGVILLAWLIGSAQSRGSSKPTAGKNIPQRPQRHFEHPNDPHFRKLRKKTS